MNRRDATQQAETEVATDGASCLLCESRDTRILQRIAASTLIAAYRAELGIVPALSATELRYLVCKRCDLRFFDPPATGNEAFYADLQKIAWYYSAAKEEFRIAAAYVTPNDRVLEIGAGRGLFSREIRAAAYTGLEFSSSAIELAAASGIHLKAESIENHANQHAAEYDIVCAFQVLEHVAAPRSFLLAATQTLKPGGRLIMSVPGEDSFARFSYWDVLNMPPHHVTRWTDRCLKEIASVCDLKLVAVTPDSLGKNMRRNYAHSMADRWLATRMQFEPQLLDERLRKPWFNSMSSVVATMIRRGLSMSSAARRGHAVVAVFRKA